MASLASVLIDGSVLEGGGQILRNSVSLSALLNKPVRINKIRNSRRPPGLKNQHRTGLLNPTQLHEYSLFNDRKYSGLELAAQISSARLTGAHNASTEIEFIPGRINLPNDFKADSVTAGSITLLLQVALPLLLFSTSPAPVSTLTLLGGTNASLAPQIDYTENIFFPFLRRHFGVDSVKLQIVKRGYFPKGGGEVKVSVQPFSGDEKLRNISLLERGRIRYIAGIAHYAALPVVVGNGMASGAMRRLEKEGFVNGESPKEGITEKGLVFPIGINVRREPQNLTVGAGSGIVLWAQLEGGGMIGGSAVGRKGLAPEEVGREAAEELLRGLNAGGCVDEVTSRIISYQSWLIRFQWLQDQIIIFMALAEGKSEVRCGQGGLALHTKCVGSYS